MFRYAAKLLKKPDQCRMVTLCSHLFWAGKATDAKHYHDPRRVLECLQRSLKIADVCMSSSMHVHLFVEILNQYLFYFESDNAVITEKYISGLIALINEHLENMEVRGTHVDSWLLRTVCFRILYVAHHLVNSKGVGAAV